ncbi:peroxide stress protein YaaA [Streptococcus caprae]|uniref:UPF0246 protein ACFORF_01065 n=2 Tax=Streptococcus caprae TaxID=1640501 RepID=A0ABV8CT80_9STRE
MLFLIPTAKEMKPGQTLPSKPLGNLSQAILNQLLTYTPEELGKLYKIKEGPAQKEWDRLQALASADTYPALQLFNGLMYRNIKRDGWSQAEQAYLEKSVYIISSLYGIIPALYPIAEHRLDFNLALKVDGQSLKNLWRPNYDAFLNQADGPIISLLSSEFEDVFSPSQRERLISLVFMEEKEGQLKIHSTISKKARGQFLTAAVEQQAQCLEDLKSLDFAGFSYRADLSKESKLVFVKKV